VAKISHLTTHFYVTSAGVVSNESVPVNMPETYMKSVKFEASFSIVLGMSANFLYNTAARWQRLFRCGHQIAGRLGAVTGIATKSESSRFLLLLTDSTQCKIYCHAVTTRERYMLLTHRVRNFGIFINIKVLIKC
jgi:hypothetical protein